MKLGPYTTTSHGLYLGDKLIVDDGMRHECDFIRMLHLAHERGEIRLAGRRLDDLAERRTAAASEAEASMKRRAVEAMTDAGASVGPEPGVWPAPGALHLPVPPLHVSTNPPLSAAAIGAEFRDAIGSLPDKIALTLRDHSRLLDPPLIPTAEAIGEAVVSALFGNARAFAETFARVLVDGGLDPHAPSLADAIGAAVAKAMDERDDRKKCGMVLVRDTELDALRNVARIARSAERECLACRAAGLTEALARLERARRA